MKKDWSIYDLMVLILVCTVSLVLILTIAGMVVFRAPATVENAPLRAGLIDLLKYIAGGILTIIGQQLSKYLTKEKAP